jgi:hypothetical protein
MYAFIVNWCLTKVSSTQNKKKNFSSMIDAGKNKNPDSE